MFDMLPYVEEGNFYRQCIETGSYTSAHTVRMYLSPADPTVDFGYPGNNLASYGANAFALKQKKCRLDSSFPDGLSNTIAFAEHYAWGCDNTQFSWYDSQPNIIDIPPSPILYVHRATFAEPSPLLTMFGTYYPPDVYPITSGDPPVARGSEAGLTFQVKPSLLDCNPKLAQTPHSSGMLIGMFDGGVRTVAPGVDPSIYWGMVTHDGGEPIQIP